MRNSELGCGGTEQRCGVAVALSYGDAAARGRWRGAEVARRSGDAVAWGCKLGGARCYWFSKRSSKEIDDISAWLGQQHDMETLSKKIKNRETSKSTSTFSKAAALNLRKQHCIGRSKMQPTESKGCQDRFLLWISHMSTAVFAFNAMHHVEG
ncbi:uncharacterized protein [Miscanthus floridulus]|uniref:uncharacterized protein isoform X2 n=1 Tax=Miscanthus floridulus TaxID=154761 RepID=UPI00345A155A